MTNASAHRTKHLAAIAALIVMVLGTPGCDDGGVPAGPAGSGSGDMLWRNAPLPGLLAISATVPELQFKGQRGSPSANLLSATAAEELLGLQGRLTWLASVESMPRGTISGLSVELEPSSCMARLQAICMVSATVQQDTILLRFVGPLPIVDAGYYRLEIELDLEPPLSGDVPVPQTRFGPRVSVLADHDSASRVMDALVNDDVVQRLADATLQVDGKTLMLQGNARPFSESTQFGEHLAFNQEALEVHGTNGAGPFVQAYEIEDYLGGAGSPGEPMVYEAGCEIMKS